MRISVKSRYGLSVMILMAQRYNTGEYATVTYLSDELKISKIYLEQAFSLLRRAGLVLSAKGAQGGYRLLKQPNEITVYDILSAIETSMFESTQDTVLSSSPHIENALRTIVYNKLDDCIRSSLSEISLVELLKEIEKQSACEGYMYYL